MKINEVAKLTGITVRTLHYYDEIGLLKPSETTDAGYRIYGEQELDTLQQILFFRELDFPLATIREIMENPDYSRTEALTRQKELLIQKRKRLDKLISLVDHTLQEDSPISFTAFDSRELEAQKAAYAREIKEKWGTTNAYQEYAEKTGSYSPQQYQQLEEQLLDQFRAFAALKTKPADDEAVRRQVIHFQNFMTSHYFVCTDTLLKQLGAMYTQDERFRKNIDAAAGEGTAAFVTAAILAY